jgi:hypothetical protein
MLVKSGQSSEARKAKRLGGTDKRILFVREIFFFRVFRFSPALSQTLSMVEGSAVEGCFRGEGF